MANYATLKAAIQNAIKTNGNNEITGASLQQSLLAMINSLGAGYQYMGIATPQTNPGTPDQNVFYIASTAGTYANFGSFVLTDGEIAILKYNGAWSKDSTGAASLETVNQLSQKVDLKIYGEADIEKDYIWGQGYVNSNGQIASSSASLFCQPILFKAGEVLTYKTGSNYSRAVVKVADATPLSVGDSNFVVAVLIDASVANTEYEYIFTADTYVVISVFAADYTLKVKQYSQDSVYADIEALDAKIDAEKVELLGYEAGKKLQFVEGVGIREVEDPDFGYSVKIPVAKGDTVVWHYPSATIYSCALGVYDSDGVLIDYYSNTTTNGQREIVLNADSLPNDFFIRASFLLAKANESWVSQNGIEVWRGVDLNSLEKDILAATGDIVTDKVLQSIPLYDNFGNFAVQGKCIDSNTWQNYGSCYMFPVSAGNVFYIKAQEETLKIYYAFLTNNTMTGTPSFVGTHQSYNSTTIWLELVVPEGATYLYFNHTFQLSYYDHTPLMKTMYGSGGIDASKLQVGTFNSSYNETDVKDKREEFCASFKGTNTIESFLFFTDPHLTTRSRYEEITEKVRDKYISVLQKYYNSLPMDRCICGGDWINSCDSFDSACDELGYADAYMRKLFKDFYPVFGNHDDNPYDWGGTGTTHQLTFTEVRNLAFRENGNLFYSFDGINTKFYVLNNCGSFVYTMDSYKWSQIDWLANKLLQDNPSHAILLSHILSNGLPSGASGSYPAWLDGVHKLSENAIKLAVAYNKRESITLNGITYNFASATGKVECYITGHLHADIVTTAFELPVITTTNLEGGGYADRLNYQNHSYALIPTFDCCLADYENGKLRMVRVGAGVNRTINLAVVPLAVGGTISLTSIFSGTITWHSENTSVVSVSNGVVTGVASGIGGIRAINENGEEEYWIIKVS